MPRRPGATEAIRATLASFPAVLACDSVRIRNAGAVLFVEITVAVCRTLPLERIDHAEARSSSDCGSTCQGGIHRHRGAADPQR
ncbi:hypothetical protein M8494_09905 [Serratia ureilytica]